MSEAYVDNLFSAANSAGNITSMGCDPVWEDMPFHYQTINRIRNSVDGGTKDISAYFDVERTLVTFFETILDGAADAGKLPAAIKPQYAFWGGYMPQNASPEEAKRAGDAALLALHQIIAKGHKLGLPVILDAKRNDIKKTSEAYCREVYDYLHVDAVTVNPYMGYDCVRPFIQRAEKEGKGVYILCRTSNDGAKDFQSKLVLLNDDSKLVEQAGNLVQKLELKNGEVCYAAPLYMVVAEKIVEWGANAGGNVGAVVGATSLDELENVATYFAKQKQPVPLLIPGVGKQGGSAGETMARLRKAAEVRKVGPKLAIHRINNSSGINFAWKETNTPNYVEAALEELGKMAKEIAYQTEAV
jgi:orotidine-5'-phosphate decarboxylase